MLSAWNGSYISSFFYPSPFSSRPNSKQSETPPSTFKKMCGQNSPPFLFYVKTLQMSNTPFYISNSAVVCLLHCTPPFLQLQSLCRKSIVVQRCVCKYEIQPKLLLSDSAATATTTPAFERGFARFFVFSCGKISASTTPKKHPPLKGLQTDYSP